MVQPNFHFNNFDHRGEQKLIEDLVTESISIFGLSVGYMAKTFSSDGFDQLYTEEDRASFEQVSDLVMYIRSVDGFEGEGDFMSKFGLEIRDGMTVCIARRHFEETVEQEQSVARPREGDLLFLPLNEKVFEIKFVEHEPVFYQMGALQFYEIRCELFEYSSERFNTGVDVIDQIQTTHSLDVFSEIELTAEDGTPLFTEDGYRLLGEDPDRSGATALNHITLESILDTGKILTEDGFFILDEDQVTQEDFDAETESESLFLETQADDFLDFSDRDPFSEGGRF